MMDYPLTVQYILQRATHYFPKRELVTVTAEGMDRSTYGESGVRVAQLSGALAKLGVTRGDRVATLAWNTTRHFECYFAIPCMGAVLHTLNLRLPSDQLGFIIQDAADKVIVADAEAVPLLEKVAGSLGSVKAIVVMNSPATGSAAQISGLPPIYDYDTLLAEQPGEFAWPELDEREACAMCYTSGTTGNPKGVVYSHRSTVLHAICTTQADTIGISGRDTAMPIVPMFHVNAWGLPHAAAMVGAKVVFPGKYMDPARVAQVMADEKVTFSGVGDRHDGSDVRRHCGAGGAARARRHRQGPARLERAGSRAAPPTGPRRQSTADRRLRKFPGQPPVSRLRDKQRPKRGHGPVFCEQKGTTAEGSRAADRLCKNLDIPVEACGARMPQVSWLAMTRSRPLRAR